MKSPFILFLGFVYFVFNSSNCLEIEQVCRKNGGDSQLCKTSVDFWLQDINKKALTYYRSLANYAWKTSICPNDPDLSDSGSKLDQERTLWRNLICDTFKGFDMKKLDFSQRKQFHLLCRSPSLTQEESEKLSIALDEMQTIYTSSKICILKLNGTQQNDAEKSVSSYLNYFEKTVSPKLEMAVDFSTSNDLNEGDENVECFSGEPDLERLVSKTHNEKILKWAWLSWRQKVGPPIRPHFHNMVKLKNQAAIRSGYKNLAEVWQEELEMENLERTSWKLLLEIMPLYTKLHKVVRYALMKKYPESFRNIRGNKIPAHLFSNLWSQNWGSLYSVIMPKAREFDFDLLIKKTNWTTFDMVKRAEDFYTSMGLFSMTPKFWKYSYFGSKNASSETGRESKCHGTAANMFDTDDFRVICCAGLSMDDFYVIHHELGHIEYYMSYDRNLPTLFQEGVNSAFQESIGDSIMYGVLSPQHLNRLGIIDDDFVYLKNNGEKRKNHIFQFDEALVLQMALIKLPQIPFGFLVDKYRWDIFSGKIKYGKYNEAFWDYAQLLQGIVPPDGIPRGENFFDAGSKFHVPDNTPYIRYFLSSFIQVQIFKGLCQWSLFGKANPELVLPMPLHRCDIYGSKKAGKQLREMMSKGSSIHWSEALFELTGEKTVNSKALLEYFQPLDDILDSIMTKYEIN